MTLWLSKVKHILNAPLGYSAVVTKPFVAVKLLKVPAYQNITSSL